MSATASLLCFFPEADLLNWYSTELVTAQAAQEFFSEVQILGCHGNMRPLCAAMTARRLNVSASAQEKARVCRSCIRAKESAQEQLNLTWVEMTSFESAEDKEIAQAIRADVTPENYLDLEYEEIAVGRYATYVPHLLAKGARLTEDCSVWEHFIAEVELVIKTIRMSQRALKAISPSAVLTSNHIYGAHRAFLAVARKQGLRTWGMGPGGLLPDRSQSIGIFPEELSSQTISLSKVARQSLSVPLSDQELSLTQGHMQALRRGKDPYVYSTSSSGLAPEQLRDLLGARPNSPVITVLLASPDEMESARIAGAEFHVGAYAGTVSPDQFLDGVIDCAESLAEVDFVVRIHPRMVANKREAVVSDDLGPLLDRLAKVPSNVSICHPDMMLSLYDNILISDAAINHTSSSGLEFMSFGLPVVHADDMRLGIYPASLGVAADGVSDLPRAVLAALESGWQLANVQQALRWWATVNIRFALFPFQVQDSNTNRESADLETARRTERKFISTLLQFAPTSLQSKLGAFHEWTTRRGFLFPIPTPPFAADLKAAMNNASSGVIWEPPLFFRGKPIDDSEATALTALGVAVSDLGWDGIYGSSSAGLGGIRRYLASLGEERA